MFTQLLSNPIQTQPEEHDISLQPLNCLKLNSIKILSSDRGLNACLQAEFPWIWIGEIILLVIKKSHTYIWPSKKSYHLPTFHSFSSLGNLPEHLYYAVLLVLNLGDCRVWTEIQEWLSSANLMHCISLCPSGSWSHRRGCKKLSLHTICGA